MSSHSLGQVLDVDFVSNTVGVDTVLGAEATACATLGPGAEHVTGLPTIGNEWCRVPDATVSV